MRYILAMLLALAPITAQAQETVVSQAGLFTQFSVRKDEDGKKMVTPRAFFDGFQAYTENCGGWLFVYSEKGYLSFMTGPYCSLFGYIEASVGLGWESLSNAPNEDNTLYGRAAAGLRIGTESRYIEGYYERGNSRSEDWFLAELGVLTLKRFDLGLYAQKGDGFGPRVRVSVPLWQNESGKSAGLSLWAAPMYDFNLSKMGKPQGILIGGEVIAVLKK